MTEPSLADLFTDSWLRAAGDDMASRAARRSLMASTYGHPELTRVLTWLTTPTQAEFDVHLTGAGVYEHQTDAAPFGKFVQRTAETVRVLAKSLTGRQRMASHLQVLAPAAGSVRVVFRAPDLADDAKQARPAHDTPSAETLALETLVEVLYAASTDDLQETATQAAVNSLEPRARAAVASTARSIRDANWDLHGELRRRGEPTRIVDITTASADRIVRAVGPETVERTDIVITGSVDGTRWSRFVMWFEPDTGHAFAASVPTPELMAEVSAVAARPNAHVQARFSKFTSFRTANASEIRRRYELESLTVIDDGESPPELF